jgi:hypothetical protein
MSNAKIGNPKIQLTIGTTTDSGATVNKRRSIKVLFQKDIISHHHT